MEAGKRSEGAGAGTGSDGLSGWTPRSTRGDRSSVRVAVRVRPFVAKEQADGCQDCTRRTGQREICIGTDRRFTFDRVYGPDTRQQEVFEEYVSELVQGCFRGFNATVFAYGQTGSGKTYTMGTGSQAALLPDELGVIPRVLHQVFALCEERGDSARVRVTVSFLEIYRELVRDLLHPDTNPKSINIRETAGGEIMVQGLRAEEALSAEAALEMLEMGSLARSTGSTLMNSESSRSHAIFTLCIEQRPLRGHAAAASSCTTAKFHLIDLAGSERAKRTGAVGIRFKESVRINQGLLALGNVISALGDPAKRRKRAHVPYRDSKLTRLLQDSLGGNSRTVMIACISPADANFEETLSTLKYANRARNIKNKPIQNVRLEQETEILALKQQVQALQSELGARDGAAPQHPPQSSVPALVAELERLQVALEEAEERNVRAAEHLFSAQSDVATCLRAMAEARAGAVELAQRRTAAPLPSDVLDTLGAIARHLEPRVPAVPQHVRPPRDGTNGDKSLLRRSIEGGSIWSPAKGGADARDSGGVDTAGEDSGEAVRALEVRAEEAERRAEALSAQLSTTVAALREAKAELNRDEEIFKAKLETIGDLHTRLTEAVDQNTVLKQAVTEADDRIHQLEAQLAAPAMAPVASGGGGSNGEGPHHNRNVSFGSVMMAEGSQVERDDDEEDDEGMVVYKDAGELSVLTDAPGSADDSVHAASSTDAPSGEAAAELEGLQRQLAQAEEHKRVLEESMAAVEAQKGRLEADLKRMTQEHERTRRGLQSSLREHTMAIRHKEELIRTLITSESEAAAAAQAFEARVRSLQSEVVKYRSTVQRVQAELEANETVLETTTKEAQEAQEALKRKYQAKLVRAKANLAEARRRQAELSKVDKGRRDGDKRIDELEHDLKRLRQEKATLAKKLKREEREEGARLDGLKRALSRVQREAELERKKGAELRAQNDRQRRELQERSREAALAQRRLSVARQQATSPSRSRSRPSTARSRSRGSPARAASTPRSVRSRTPSHRRRPSAAAIRTHWSKSRDAVAAAVTATVAGSQLKRSMVGREQVVQERARVLHERAELLRTKTERMGQVATRRAGLLQAARALDAQLNALAAAAGGDAAADARRDRELQRLGQQRQAALAEVEALDKRIDADEFLDDDDTARLEGLNDRLEALEAQIKYKTSAIDAQRQSLAAQGGESGTLTAVARVASKDRLAVAFKVPLNAARGVLRKALEELVAVRCKLQAQEGATKATELRLAEKETEAENLAIALRRAKVDFDRRLTTRQQRFEAKTTRLVRQLRESSIAALSVRSSQVGSRAAGDGSSAGAPAGSASPQLPQIAKENAYYKSTNRELRHHLRAAVKANENLKAEVRTQSASATLLRQQNEALQEELTNIKAFLRRRRRQVVGDAAQAGHSEAVGASSTGVRAVRLSASSLRELTPQAVAARLSADRPPSPPAPPPPPSPFH